MKLLMSSLLLGGFLWGLEIQASETTHDNPEYIPIHQTTPQELKKAIGQDKLDKIIAYAPKQDFMRDDTVLLYSIGRQRIEAEVCTLTLNNNPNEAEHLKELKELLAH